MVGRYKNLKEDAELLTGELVNNAIRHASTELTPVVAVAEGTLEIGATDLDPRYSTCQAWERMKEGVLAEGGRGLCWLRSWPTNGAWLAQKSSWHHKGGLNKDSPQSIHGETGAPTINSFSISVRACANPSGARAWRRALVVTVTLASWCRRAPTSSARW